ncbi:hypothetical protein JNL27_11050 [bacterium]|nr:hypothetical protein [bacterium]
MILCEHESETRQAMADGHWSDALRQHSIGCESCRLTIGLYPAIKNLSEKTNIKASLPYYRWILVQAEMQKEKARHELLQRISLIAVSGTVAVCILIVTGIYYAQGYLPDTAISHITRFDFPIIGILTALWIISEFQLRTFFNLKSE